MKPKFKIFLLLSLFALLFVTSCQKEVFEETQNEDQILNPNSTIVNLMQSTVTNNGSVDDILDESNCFTVNLPVTIVANGITITINSLDDLELLEEIFEEFNDDNDFLEFFFPITIILNNYTQITIENEDQLNDFIEECIGNDEVIECVDFVYPISFSIFNSEFVIIDTVVIHSDEELYEFLNNLNNSNDNVVIASLNFPVSLKYADGTIVEVHSNQELQAAMELAEELCDDDNEDCDLGIQGLEEILKECQYEAKFYSANNDLLNVNQLDFNADGELIVNGVITVTEEGTWSLSETDEGYVLTIEGLEAFENVNGNWLLTNCYNEYLTFTDGDVRMKLDQDCENDIDCSAQEISANLVECQWYGVSSLYNTVAPEIFTFFENGTVSIANDPTANSGTWDIQLTSAGVVLVLHFDNDPNNLLSREWLILECDDQRIKGWNGDHYVVFEQDCNNGNPFECYHDTELVKCDDDVLDGLTEFNLELAYPNCNNDDVEVSFHATLGDAETDVNQLPTAYTNVTNPQIIYAKVTLAGSTTYEVFEVQLYVEDCTTDECTELEVDDYLQTCVWNIVSYNESDDLVIFTLDFNENQDLTITGDGQTITAGWSTSQSNDGVVVDFSNVAGSNIQAITGSWTIVECAPDRLKMVKGDDFMVLEQDCE
jgi:hypothetical protein